MTRVYSTTIDLIDRRVRQLTNAGGANYQTNKDLTSQILGMCERLANCHLRAAKATTAFSTTAYTAIYDYRSTLTSAIDILEITESNRPLLKCDTLNDLNALDIDWFRYSVAAASHRFEAWCQIGRDFLILYPMKQSNGSSDLSITYSKLVTGYADYSALTTETLTLADEDAELAVAMAELVMLARFRQLNDVKIRVAKIASMLGLEVE